ncbi:uncharacterized protein LOC111912310 [Lactuca sativa]|uniref:uncharacterized protein LOC111912310 n=1 Tax=Lactuca sativa TaxID=4236 RepID=UPI000CD7E553|nr:uncharacterized protein LOC111912310 [Lactuca sativa]
MHEGKKICISDKDPTTMIETDLKRKNAKDKNETKTPKKRKHQSKKSPSKRKTPEKQLHDSETDFKSRRPLKKAKKESPIKKEKKTVVKEFYSMKNRCSPESLLSIILWLSKKQKECVRSMCFGSLLKMKITDIPLKLRFYILQKFDYERMEIDVKGKELKVTTQSVHDMLGIPKGGTILTQLDQWPKDDTKKIRYRETFEQEKARFGLEELNEEFVNEQDEGDIDLEDNDSDKDEDHSVEGNGEQDNDNDESQPEVDYLLDSNEVENEGIKNDGDKNQKEGETEVKEKDGKNN